MHIHLDNVRNLLPLLRPGVHTGGVVGTGMQQNHTLLWDRLSLKKKRRRRGRSGVCSNVKLAVGGHWDGLSLKQWPGMFAAIISVLQRCHQELP